MKKVIDLKVALVALAAAGMFASCSDDGPDGPDGYYRVIGFENSGLTLAGPTSKGDNLYESYDGTKFLEGRVEVESGVDMVFGINESSGMAAWLFRSGTSAVTPAQTPATGGTAGTTSAVSTIQLRPTAPIPAREPVALTHLL